MGHKAATLEYPSRSERYYREPQLPIGYELGQSLKSRTITTTSLVNQNFAFVNFRLRSRRRRANYKPLVVLAPTLVLGLMVNCSSPSYLMVVKLLHQSSLKLTTKVAVLPSPAQVNPPAISPVVSSRAIIGQEDDFQSLNSHSGALGLAQIMPANLARGVKTFLVIGLRLMSF